MPRSTALSTTPLGVNFAENPENSEPEPLGNQTIVPATINYPLPKGNVANTIHNGAGVGVAVLVHVQWMSVATDVI